MDLNGIANGGVFVPIAAFVAALVVVAAVVWYARRSAAKMAQRHREWVEQLPASTGSRTPDLEPDLDDGRREFRSTQFDIRQRF